MSAAPRPETGAFIVLEGGEGAGKGTILAELAARLRARNRDVVTTREPGGTPEGLKLRELLLGHNGESWDPWAELLLMTAARVQHARNLIEPARKRGTIVLCDRFVGSTLAYQGAGRGMPEQEIMRLHDVAVGNLMPDLTIVLDVDPRIGVQRSLARLQTEQLDEGRFEKLDLDFHNRVRRSFLDQAAAYPDRHSIIDASQPLPAVAQAATAALLTYLGLGP